MTTTELVEGCGFYVLRADQGYYIQRKDISWQRGNLFIVRKPSIPLYEEKPRVVVANGQFMFPFMGGDR